MKNSTLEITILEPTHSENWLTNGETVSQKVYLAPNDSTDNWSEITNTEKENLEKEILQRYADKGVIE